MLWRNSSLATTHGGWGVGLCSMSSTNASAMCPCADSLFSEVRMTDLYEMTACQLLKGYADRTFSPVEAVSSVLERIEVVQPRVNAFCRIDAEAALDAAKASQERWRRG